MKILFVATVRSHIGQFHMPFIKELKKAGHEVHAAFKDNSEDKRGLDLSAIDRTFQVPFERNPVKVANLRAYCVLKKIIETEHYDIIHCHTPMGGVLTRLAAQGQRKRGAKVFYTAHGFHFYRGAPLKNWLLFYPIEKWLSKKTDVIILINHEDYETALRKGFSSTLAQVHGVGVELDRYDRALRNQKAKLRKEYGIPDDTFTLLYPADLSYRKNQRMLLKAVSEVKADIPNVCLLLPGQPIQHRMLEKYADKLGIASNVRFLGYRRDIPNLIALSDVCVSSSRQEGLPMNIVEGMAMGKAVVATNVRGNSDLVEDGRGGFLVELNDSAAMADALERLYKNPRLLEKMGDFNLEKIKDFSSEAVNRELLNVYFGSVGGGVDNFFNQSP